MLIQSDKNMSSPNPHPSVWPNFTTNLDFPKVRGFPCLNYLLGEKLVWSRYNLTRSVSKPNRPKKKHGHQKPSCSSQYHPRSVGSWVTSVFSPHIWEIRWVFPAVAGFPLRCLVKGPHWMSLSLVGTSLGFASLIHPSRQRHFQLTKNPVDFGIPLNGKFPETPTEKKKRNRLKGDLENGDC